MRFHLLAPPNIQTTGGYSLDVFGMITMRFARLLKGLGHTVILYGSEDNETPCDEFVSTISRETQLKYLGKMAYQTIVPSPDYPLWSESSKVAIREIRARKKPGDFICSISGYAHQTVATAFPDLMFVEYSIGYRGSFSKYRVFQSDAWRHFTYGTEQNIVGKNFDEVIPAFFDLDEFTLQRKKDSFVLYIGRLTADKGVSVACRAARVAGVKLLVAGYGNKALVTDGAEYIGVLTGDRKKELMARASAVLVPTQYLEPFGCVVVEAQLCGTPVITSDFGSFREIVEEGRTGYRCHYLGEFVRAIQRRGELDPEYIRCRAIEQFSTPVVAPRYQKYFDRLNLLWGDGWNVVD